MDFVGYAERSAGLVNADVRKVEHLRHLLEGREWLAVAVGDKDVVSLRRFVRELRAVFEASNAGGQAAVVEQLNALLARHPFTAYISGHEPGRWHMHVADRQSSVADVLIGESLMGLAKVVCDLGATRLGVCDARSCDQVFVDTSPNRSRRYCSDRCSSRSNVAAYRARQRASMASA